MCNKNLSFAIRTLITAAIYAALLLPFQNTQVAGGIVGNFQPGSSPVVTGIAGHFLSGFVPVVLGIFWGWPAALGIFIGNLFCLFFYDSSPFLIAIPLFSGLTAICARWLFYAPWNKHLIKGMYIHDLWSLSDFICTFLALKLAFACAIGVILNKYVNVPLLPAIDAVFFNNIRSCVFIGIPVILYLPLLRKWADIPACAIDRNPALYGFHSLRYTIFRRMVLVAIISSILLCTIIFLLMEKSEDLQGYSRMLHICAIVTIVYIVIFSIMSNMIQKSMVAPIQEVASSLAIKGENYSNEIDIISKRLNFIASKDAELLSSDEHSIIIGLTAKDNSRRYSVEEARMIINDICLRHVSGYISSVDGVGGYKGEKHSGMEQMLIYSIIGATDEQICHISDDVIATLNQESVLIVKNKLLHYYYYGSDSYLREWLA